MKQNFLSAEDLEELLSELDSIPVKDQEPLPMTEEELASQRRYEEIIKKHK